MPGLFDIIQTLLGRPDPTGQLAAALNPTAAPGGPPGAGPPASSSSDAGGASPAGQGGGAAPPPAPPQAQAYTSPPDLVSMYMQLSQRQQANETFNRGAGLLAASMFPGRRPDLIMNAMTNATQDPGALLGNLTKLYGWQQQQQMLQGYRTAIPGILKSLNLDPSYGPLLMSDPQLMGSIISSRQPEGQYRNWLLAREDSVKRNSDPNDPQSQERARSSFEQQNPLPNVLMTGGGDPALTQLRLETNDWQARHPGQPLPDWFGSTDALAAHKKQIGDLTSAQTQNSATLGDLDQGLTKMRSDAAAIAQNPQLDSLLAKSNKPGLLNIARKSGWASQNLPAGYDLNQDQLDLLHKIDDLSQYNTSTFKSANPHLGARLGTIDSQLSTLQQFDSGAANWKKNLSGLVDQVDNTRANAAGAAGQLGRVLDAQDSDLEMKVDPSYLPGGRNFLGEPKQLSPQEIADAQKTAIPQWEKEHPGEGRTRYIRHMMLQGYSPAGL